MTQVALIRHFPTDWNKEQRLQGRTDIPLAADALAELGQLQMPEPWRSARLFTSTLTRAVQTATSLADGRTPIHDDRLIEISWGDWEGQCASALMADPGSGFRPTHEWDLDTAAPGGESMRAAMQRVRPALREIATDADRAVIVTHKALMRVILGTAHEWSIAPEIKRRRLYPLILRPTGLPREPSEPIRLEPRR